MGLENAQSADIGFRPLPSSDIKVCSSAHEVESCRVCGAGVTAGELSSWLDRKATVGSKDMSVTLRLGLGDVKHGGAEAGIEGEMVVVGRINGFKETDPEGNRRILRCRLMDVAWLSISGSKGRPQEVVPSEEDDCMEVGLDEGDRADRWKFESPDPSSIELNCLEPRSGLGGIASSSEIAESIPSGDSDMLDADPKLLECQKVDSDTVDNDNRTPPGEQGTRGSMDLGLGVLLCGSALLGEEVAE